MFTGGGFGLFVYALLGLSAITCGTFLLGGWQRQRHLQRAQAVGEPVATAQPLFGLARAPFVGGVLDVTAEARDVLAQMAGEAARHLVQLEFAVQPDLSVHADPLALRGVLSELVGNAVRHAPGGRVLLSATRLGGRVQIAVIDDGAGPTAAVREAALREVAQVVALQGGTIDIEVHPGEGTTILVRLPDQVAAGNVPAEAPKQQPAEHLAAPPRAAQEVAAEHS